MAFLPLAFLIVYALKTRKMADAMVLATLLAVLLVHRQHFFTGLIDAMYTTLGNSSYQFALCSILGFGGGRVSECPDYHHLPAGCLR